ncbi:metalloproteinase inhibitor 4 [Pseudophryne corroboree]|uniref:metalloproteinase inhibitor 4 n=1 Tax=Pseudophryne corroboree TaxID=495146 RepID=UPI003081BE33
MNPFIHTLLFCALFFFTLKELTEACSCLRAHPQEHFCHSDVVVRAKAIAEKRIPSTNKAYRTIMYTIKVIKMFKGFQKIKNLSYVYTESDSAMCGVKLDVVNKREYILSGYIYDNKVHIDLCCFIQSWDSLSGFQIRSLSHTYQLGCECQIKICAMDPCESNDINECLWTDWVKDQMLYGNQAENYACIRHKDGSCGWYPNIFKKTTIHP